VLILDHALAEPGRLLRRPADRAAIVLLSPTNATASPAIGAAGFSGYLIKPLRRASLAERVLVATGARPTAAAARGRADRRRRRPAPASCWWRTIRSTPSWRGAPDPRGLRRRPRPGGEEALAAVKVGVYDLILMDMRMPGLSARKPPGACGAWASHPIVALTANAFDGRPPGLPGRRHGRFPGQAALARRPAHHAGALDQGPLDGIRGARQGRLTLQPERPDERGRQGADRRAAPQSAPRWKCWRQIRQPKVAVMLALGFSSGLPFLLTGNTFGYWLRDEGTSLKAIGFLPGWAGLHLQGALGAGGRPGRRAAPGPPWPPARLDGALQIVVAAGLVGMALVGPSGG
jgi:CheY-like chemotaxis protein